MIVDRDKSEKGKKEKWKRKEGYTENHIQDINMGIVLGAASQVRLTILGEI